MTTNAQAALAAAAQLGAADIHTGSKAAQCELTAGHTGLHVYGKEARA